MTTVSQVSSQYSVSCFFFFQAEDGIRDVAVTGVQTCALPILLDLHAQCGGIRAFIDNIEPLSPGDFIGRWMSMFIKPGEKVEQRDHETMADFKIGRASCRERV